MRDFGRPKLFITSRNRTTLIDGDRALATLQRIVPIPSGGFDTVRCSPREHHEPQDRDRTRRPAGLRIGIIRSALGPLDL